MGLTGFERAFSCAAYSSSHLLYSSRGHCCVPVSVSATEKFQIKTGRLITKSLFLFTADQNYVKESLGPFKCVYGNLVCEYMWMSKWTVQYIQAGIRVRLWYFMILSVRSRSYFTANSLGHSPELQPRNLCRKMVNAVVPNGSGHSTKTNSTRYELLAPYFAS